MTRSFATTNQTASLIAKLHESVKDLTFKQAQSLLSMTNEELRGLLQSAVSTAHRDICIQFELGGYPFEAVGFLMAGERSITGYEAFRRCNAGSMVVCSDKDWSRFQMHCHQLPAALHAYTLTANRQACSNGKYSDTSILHRIMGHWAGDRTKPNIQWGRDALVVRRRKIN